MDEGEEGCGEDCENRGRRVECRQEYCRAGEGCQNMVGIYFFLQVITTATHCNTGHHQWFERASDNEAGKAGDHGSIACRKLLGAVHW